MSMAAQADLALVTEGTIMMMKQSYNPNLLFSSYIFQVDYASLPALQPWRVHILMPFKLPRHSPISLS